MTCPSQSSRLLNPDYIKRTGQTIKLLILKPSSLHIRIQLGSKYSPQDRKLYINFINYIIATVGYRVKPGMRVYTSFYVMYYIKSGLIIDTTFKRTDQF